jgi:UPF0271 protein
MLSIDLNCDMGESTSIWHYDIKKDFELLNYVSSINIACGNHAGDAVTMQLLTDAAIKNNIAVGAHPSFPDKEKFGRTYMQFSRERIYEMVQEQMMSLNEILKVPGKQLHHVKPHGALYNMAARDKKLADAICHSIADFDNRIILYGLSGSELIKAGKEAGLKTCSEAFADRTYQQDGSLTSRTEAGALIYDPDKAAGQVLQMITKKTVIALSGHEVPINAETICIHGDGAHAVEFAQTINELLKSKGIQVRAPL